MEIQPITWEAAATLIAGLSAVAGATIIGSRQIQIMELQRSLEQQNSERDFRLREQELRISLLQKRGEIIERIRPIWGTWLRNGRLSRDEIKELIQASYATELVFSPAIAKDISTFALRMDELVRRYDRLERSGDRYQEELAKIFALEDEIRPDFQEIMSRMALEARVELLTKGD